jgi:hypothetical protein
MLLFGTVVDDTTIIEDGTVTTVSEADIYRRAREAFEGRSWEA